MALTASGEDVGDDHFGPVVAGQRARQGRTPEDDRSEKVDREQHGANG